MIGKSVSVITLHSIMSMMGSYQWLTVYGGVGSSPRYKQ